MRLTPSHYLQRAAELETLAAQVSDSAMRKGYQDLAQSFRELANTAGIAQMPSDTDIVRLAERMVGKPSNTH
jgi:hypothetical protein